MSTTSKVKTCYNCGNFWPHQHLCPAMNKTCRNCGKRNHISKVCRSRSNPRLRDTHQHQPYRPLDHIEYQEHPSTEDENASEQAQPNMLSESLFLVNQVSGSSKLSPFKTKVKHNMIVFKGTFS